MIERTFTVTNFQMDENWKMRITAFMELAQQYGEDDCDAQGFGYDNLLEKHNDAWVFLKAHFDIVRRPGYGETLTFRTFHKGLIGPLFIRRHEIEDGEGSVLMSAEYACCIINLESRSIQRPEKYGFPNEVEEGLVAPDKLVVPSGASLESEVLRTVCYSDVDYNHHVNNISYMRWAMDALGELPYKREFKSVTANFVHEIPKGAQVRVRVYDVDGVKYVTVTGDLPRPAFIAKVE